MPTTLDTTPTRSLAHRRAELADRLTTLDEQIKGLAVPAPDSGWEDAPRRPPVSLLRQAGEALADGAAVADLPNVAQLQHEANVVREALAVLDERIAAEQLAALADDVPALNDAVRAALTPVAKWIASMPAAAPAIQRALDELRVAHAEAGRLGAKAKTSGTVRPAFDVALEHAGIEVLELIERVAAVRLAVTEAKA